jgi:glycosyltransferase involved in cell wall biosynthesis
MSMKVLSILPVSPPAPLPGGAELQKHSLHKALRAQGVDVHVLADSVHFAKEYQVFEGVPIWASRFPVLTSHPFRPGNIQVITSLMALWRLMEGVTKGGRIDVIHSTFFRESALVGAFLSRRLHAPLVISLECSGKYGDFSYIRSNWLLRLSQGEIIRRTSRIVALGESTLQEAVANGVPPDKVTIIPNAVVNMKAVPTENTADLRTTGPMLYVGRMVAQKRIDTLIASIAALVEVGAARKLVMVGGGVELSNWRTEVEKRGLVNWVDITGFDPHPEAHLEHAACFISPSESEGWGCAAVEACAFGVPVILSDVPEHRAIAQAVGMEEFLFPVGDAIALSQRIRALFDLPEHQYSELKRRCASYGQRFTREKRDDAYLRLFESTVRAYRAEFDRPGPDSH